MAKMITKYRIFKDGEANATEVEIVGCVRRGCVTCRNRQHAFEAWLFNNYRDDQVVMCIEQISPFSRKMTIRNTMYHYNRFGRIIYERIKNDRNYDFDHWNHRNETKAERMAQLIFPREVQMPLA